MTVLIIVANVIAFLADQANQESALVEVNGRLARVAIGGLSEQYAMIPANVTGDFAQYGLTILTSMFLHANWLHIGGNMLSLWVFGNNVEDAVGRGRFVLFYLLCGAAAAAVHIASGPGSETPTVGASGAVAGVMGAYLILYPQAEVLSIVPFFIFSTITEVPAILVIGFWALMNFVNANWFGGGEMTGGGVAYFAHIGGFIAGIVLIAMLGGKGLLQEKARPYYDDPFGYR
jgi:membrane associated rhomboid family serine protease